MSSHQHTQHSSGRVSDGSVTSTTALNARQTVGTSRMAATNTPMEVDQPAATQSSPSQYTPGMHRSTAPLPGNSYLRNAMPQEPLSVKEVTTRVCDHRLLSTRVKRLKTEYEDMMTEPPPNCSASPKGDDLNEWVATIQGPESTVYEGGTFFLDVQFPKDYPYIAPKIRFTTRIYHCNINSQGVICLDILKNNWSPALTLAKILLSLSSLMCDCNPDDPLVGSVAKLYLTDRAEHDKNARQWTAKFAT